jgi:hypothetical protein
MRIRKGTTRYDYKRQAWVKDGWYVRCGHPETMKCICYGRLHEGELAPYPSSHIVLWDEAEDRRKARRIKEVIELSDWRKS